MSTLLVSQTNSARHRVPEGHPDRPERIDVVRETLATDTFARLIREDAPAADITLASNVHGERFFERLRDARPAEGIGSITQDTFIADTSLKACATALGAGIRALDAVVHGEVENAFCAIRPPGHHAERERTMGFCLINSIASVARMAQTLHGAERVAIVDFDAHHGNGTQDIVRDDPTIFYASSHQMPLFPHTGDPRDTGVGNLVNVALDAGSDGADMRAAYRERILPALDAFSPDILFISAGFDADRRDPLAALLWDPADFAWLTGKLLDIAEKRCSNRVVSMLEGGYDADGLAEGVRSHVKMLSTGMAG